MAFFLNYLYFKKWLRKPRLSTWQDFANSHTDAFLESVMHINSDGEHFYLKEWKVFGFVLHFENT